MMKELQDAITGAVKKAGESTVSVSTRARPPFPPFGRHPRRGVGSGVVLDQEGHVLTNRHVVDDARQIVVTLNDGRILAGQVIGSDDETDIAVVQVEESDLVPAEMGDSDALEVGQPVLAIGNPLGLSGGPTVTSGVVSSIRRSLRMGNGNGLGMIQTDAAVNPGNSGGPLVNYEGQVVAINAATVPYADGIGFAIPINAAISIARQIIDHGQVRRPWLGITGYDVNRRVAYHYRLSANRGVLVVEITPDSPAEAAGLRMGDVILSLQEESLGSVGDLVEALRSRNIDDEVTLEVERGGKRSTVRAKLGTRPF